MKGTAIYAVCWSTQATLEAEWDDPSVKDMGLGDLASPTLTDIVSEESLEEYLVTLKDTVQRDISENLYEDPDQPSLLPVDTSWLWMDSGWEGKESVSRTLFLHDGPEDAIAAIVIYKLTVR